MRNLKFLIIRAFVRCICILPRIDRLHYILTETKLDSTIYDSVVTVDGYNIIRNDKNKKGRGVGYYIRNNTFYNRKNYIFDNIENVFFIDLLFTKSKPISVGIIYISQSDVIIP